jgi:ATP-dependent exoDNAse (exonuclease V) beta subunit
MESQQLRLEFEVPAPSLPLVKKPTTIPEMVEDIKRRDAELDQVKIDIDSFGPWSFSKYKSLKKCPFQFYLKYILKFKVPENLQLESDPVSANVGKAAHEILENILLGKSVEKSYAKVKKDYVDKGILSEELWETKVNSLEYNITKFQERIEGFHLRTPVKRVLTELRMGVTRNFEQAGFFSKDVWIRGVIDLVLVLECMDAVIFDHKTGGGQGSVKNYEEQLDWYKVLFHFGVNKVKGAQTGVHFIGEGEVKMASYSSETDIENHVKNSIVMSLEGAIEMLLEKGYFKHVRGSYCKWCEYDNIGCKSGELKPLELTTKRWIPIRKVE